MSEDPRVVSLPDWVPGSLVQRRNLELVWQGKFRHFEGKHSQFPFDRATIGRFLEEMAGYGDGESAYDNLVRCYGPHGKVMAGLFCPPLRRADVPPWADWEMHHVQQTSQQVEAQGELVWLLGADRKPRAAIADENGVIHLLKNNLGHAVAAIVSMATYTVLDLEDGKVNHIIDWCRVLLPHLHASVLR